MSITSSASVNPPTTTTLLSALGDYVWFDDDLDGQQDSSEPPVSGVTVQLLQNGVVIATTTTDGTGHYLFDNLIPGTYQVRFIAPDGSTLTTPNTGVDATDSDAGTNGYTGNYTLAPGERNLTVDAGIVRPIDLSLVKDVVAGAVRTGHTVSFTINVTNHGPVVEPGPLVVTDNLPIGLEYVSAAGTGWTCEVSGQVSSGQTITCTRPGPLAVGSTAPTITVSAKVLATTGTLKNTATVKGGRPETNYTNNTDGAEVELTPIDLAIDKSIASGSAGIGDTLVYRIVAWNNGPAVEAGPITVTDTLPTPPPPTNPSIPPVDGSEQHIFLPLLSSPAW